MPSVFSSKKEVVFSPSFLCFPELSKHSSDPDCLSLGFMDPQIAEQDHFLFFLCLPDAQAGGRVVDKKWFIFICLSA